MDRLELGESFTDIVFPLPPSPSCEALPLKRLSVWGRVCRKLYRFKYDFCDIDF